MRQKVPLRKMIHLSEYMEKHNKAVLPNLFSTISTVVLWTYEFNVLIFYFKIHIWKNEINLNLK